LGSNAQAQLTAKAPLASPVFTDSIKISAASAPGSPTEGQIYYNTADKKVYVWNGAWKALNDAPQNSATGGNTISTYDAGDYTYRYHIFTGGGTFTPNQAFNIEYLVIGGGGGGADGWRGGGGGAGGYRSSVSGEKTGGGGNAESAVAVTAQAYTITVGTGGAGGAAANGTNGTVSSIAGSGFTTITALGGGGGGGNYVADADGNAGGSGGGGGGYNGDAGEGGSASSPTQGYVGGNGLSGTGSGNSIGGGGGGSGGVGYAGVSGTGNTGGDGGVGLSSSITDSATMRGGGGGAGNYDSSNVTVGGSGGGGAGGTGNPASPGPVAGTANTGGGGGGQSTTADGAAGGSGIVIIRYVYVEDVPLPQATIAEIEAQDNVDKYVSPDLLHRHPGVAKAFCVIEGVGSLQAGSHNVASITDTGTGDSTVVIATDFSGSGYTVASNSYDKDTVAFNVVCNTFAAGSVRNATYNCESNALQDTQRGWIAYGDQ